MSKDYSNYVQFLAAEYNILYIGRESETMYDETSAYFLSASKVDMTKELLTKIDSVLMKRHVSIVVLDARGHETLVQEYYRSISKFNEDILTILLCEQKNDIKFFDIVSYVDAIVTYPIDKEIFHKKLFTVLSRSYALNSIGRREIILKQDNVTQESIDKFFDTYEGSALFVADDLMDMVKELNAGNLTRHFFANIALKLDEIANIFSKTDKTKQVTPIYETLASYLRELDLNTVAPQNLHGFSYLSNILNDVSVYLMDMFVDRIFKDVHVFEDSLKNNIEFMENSLAGLDEEDDSSELDFF